MGNNRDKVSGSGEIYCLTKREVRIISGVWKSVETDLAHYGNQFYTLLFRHHPEYFKYFQQNIPHEFQVNIPAMRIKFSLLCSTLAALFVDYAHKSQPREHLLGYVAMVHKDMNLTQNDMENLMIGMMEMLMQQFPKQLTADCVLSYVRYAGSLITRIQNLMITQREFCRLELIETGKKDRKVGCFPRAKCSWLFCNEDNDDLIYGHPMEYWNMKNRHWTLQRAMWATTSQEESSESSRKDTIPKNSIFDTSLTSKEDESSSSDGNSDRDRERPLIVRKRLTPRQQNNISITYPEIAGKSNDEDTRLRRPIRNTMKTGIARREFTEDKNDWNCTNQLNEARPRRVSIVNPTPRERRRQTLREKVTSDGRSTTLRLTIQKKTDTSGPTQGHDFSPDELEEKVITASLQSLNVKSGQIKDRGTSISNAPDYRNQIKRTVANEGDLPTGLSAKTDPPSSIIGPGTTEGRSIKSNKRVSISDFRWLSPRESDEEMN